VVSQSESEADEMKKSIIGHITPVGGNVFLDLGFPPDVAAAMLAESNEEIRLKMLAQQSKANATYEPDDGPLTAEALRQVQARAQKPKGKGQVRSRLFPES